MHHRATGCPNEYPRKLVRTTVSNDAAPVEGPLLESPDVGSRLDLGLDRVNAVLDDEVVQHSSDEL